MSTQGLHTFTAADTTSPGVVTADIGFGGLLDNGPGNGGVTPPIIISNAVQNGNFSNADASFVGGSTGHYDDFTIYLDFTKPGQVVNGEKGMGVIFRSDDFGSGFTSPMYSDGDYIVMYPEKLNDTTYNLRVQKVIGGVSQFDNIIGTVPYAHPGTETRRIGVNVVDSICTVWYELTPFISGRVTVGTQDLTEGSDTDDLNDSGHDAFGLRVTQRSNIQRGDNLTLEIIESADIPATCQDPTTIGFDGYLTEDVNNIWGFSDILDDEDGSLVDKGSLVLGVDSDVDVSGAVDIGVKGGAIIEISN